MVVSSKWIWRRGGVSAEVFIGALRLLSSGFVSWYILLEELPRYAPLSVLVVAKTNDTKLLYLYLENSSLISQSLKLQQIFRLLNHLNHREK